MKELIKSTKRLQREIDKYIPKLVHLLLFHNKMGKTVKVFQRLQDGRLKYTIIGVSYDK